MAVITGARFRTGANAGVSGDTTGYGPFVLAGVPVDGTSGTQAGVAEKGAICIDTTNGKLYVNGNTKASPTWKLVTSAA
jgi:hypothetical protein